MNTVIGFAHSLCRFFDTFSPKFHYFGETDAMNHDDALRLSAADRYLRMDLDERLRDEFEEHFFACTACATDVRQGAAMLDRMKIELASEPPTRFEVVRDAKKRLFLWPACAAAMAAMVSVIGYQNLIQVPRLKTEMASLHAPELLSSVSLGDVSRADKQPSADVKPGKPVLLAIDIPADDRYSSYEISVLDPAGTQLWTMPISAQQARDTLSIAMPLRDSKAGTYTLIIKGLGLGADPITVERQHFHLYSRY